MDPTSIANRHDLEVDESAPANGQVRGSANKDSHTLNSEVALQRPSEGGVPVHESNVLSSSPGTASHDLSRRADTAAATEIGDLDGRIPTGQNTRDQLAAARNSKLPVEASRTAQSHPRTGDGSEGFPATACGHRSSNYAPGYEKASDVVPQKTYSDMGHTPAVLPHEQLGLVQGNAQPDRYAHAPELPARTNQHSADITSDATNIPGPSLARKVKGVFAQGHGAGEVLRGNINAAINDLAGDRVGEAEDEEIVRKGQGEFTSRDFEKKAHPPV